MTNTLSQQLARLLEDMRGVDHTTEEWLAFEARAREIAQACAPSPTFDLRKGVDAALSLVHLHSDLVVANCDNCKGLGCDACLGPITREHDDAE